MTALSGPYRQAPTLEVSDLGYARNPTQSFTPVKGHNSRGSHHPLFIPKPSVLATTKGVFLADASPENQAILRLISATPEGHVYLVLWGINVTL